MLGALATVVTWLIGLFLKRPPPPKPEERAGRAEANLANAENAIVELQAAAAARAAADAERVRNDPHAGDVTLDPGAAINRDPNNHFRD